MQDVSNPDLSARIARTLPLRNGRRLPQVVDALLDEDAHQRGRQALAHRPAFERRVRGDAVSVTLGNEASSPSHHEGGSHLCGRPEGCVHCLFHLGGIELRRQRLLGQSITHGPLLCGGVGQPTLEFDRCEIHRVLPTGSVTHPWSPRYWAVRVTPFGSVMCTALLTRSITGFPTCARSA